MFADSKKTVYLVRHGQSEGNVSASFQTLDSPLSDVGKSQAKELAKRFSKIDFDVLISSPLPRAMETAKTIGSVTGLKPEYFELFREREKPESTVGKLHSDKGASLTYQKWIKSLYTHGMRVENGENFDDIVSRSDEALAFLEERSESSIVVVTHGYFLRTILARVLLQESLNEKSLMNFHLRTTMQNTGISVLTYVEDHEEQSSGWHLWVYNDHSHLG